MMRCVSAALLVLALAACNVSAQVPDCEDLQCHKLAYCDFNAANESYCSCPPGTIDNSNGAGQICKTNAFSVRYVKKYNPPGDVEGELTVDDLLDFCASDADGVYVRTLDRVVEGIVNRNEDLEVNCLYSSKPADDYLETSEYLDTPRLCRPMNKDTPDETKRCRAGPAIYAWTLPTTEAPLRIPPTGLNVDSVHFNTSCAETGCWVIRGTMTTGEANNKFEAFNTFFLPQTNGSSDLSYDYDYSAVEWTFAPADHPCTSANYNAGTSTNNQISTCCIDFPSEGAGGGFVPNYRPTEAFVDWADGLKCDEKFTDANGKEVCWKLYTQRKTWQEAQLRCKVAGGYLVTIESEAENQRLLSLIASNSDVGDGVWIGFTDDKNESNWEWVDGSPAAYTNWQPGQPLAGRQNLCPEEEGFPAEQLPASFFDVFEDLDAEDQADFVWFCRPENYAWLRKRGGAESAAGQWSSQLSWDNFYGPDFRDGWHEFVCEFDPPSQCISHVVQRPAYSAPAPKADECWEVSEGEADWDTAAGDCAEKAGRLLVIEDLEEHFLLTRVLKAAGATEAWIGLEDRETEGAPVWVNGVTLDWGYWGAANYDNYFDYYTVLGFQDWRLDAGTGDWEFVGEGERVLEMGEYYMEQFDCFYFKGADSAWASVPCGEQIRYVCELPRVNASTCHSDIRAQDPRWDVPFPRKSYTFLDVGRFKGMPASPGVVRFENLDPFFGQFAFEIQLDEQELREKAGKLRGTVGVEHTVDTFLGLANFRPTGIAALDTFATQTAIHLEKTNFFSVSTHGVNEYTFLEYVNMRLVAVYNEDKDFSAVDDKGADESTQRFIRTDSTLAGHYVQVTFTLGAQYGVNNLAGAQLIPPDSVLAGKGAFLEGASMVHKCVEWNLNRLSCNNAEECGAATPTSSGEGGALQNATNNTHPDQNNAAYMSYLLNQGCAPQAQMCASPASIPDQFVAFNIPLGIDFLPPPAADLSASVFVSLVVNAVDESARDKGSTPNRGGDPLQVKTTLTASIPVVAGGVNIFCDGITAKTDLKDVANVDIVVGSAASAAELTRLRILEDIASTDLGAVASQRIQTDTIESALMTLVIKGNASYFATGSSNTGGYALELDDVITLHLMQGGQATNAAKGDGSKEGVVLALLDTPGADSQDAAGLDTDGYLLNGAFEFVVNREAGTASLEPTAALLAQCPFNPPRPLAGNSPVESCILRRDVRLRGFPAREGSVSTAMEILAASTAAPAVLPQNSEESTVDALASSLSPSNTPCAECTFLAAILGQSDYAKQLAVDFAKAIHNRYKLNGRYRRAYWINPGYEWTPTQTGGRALFSVSQKIYLFALISLDENWSVSARRRMLLQTANTPQDAGSGVGSASLAFAVSPKSMLAGSFSVPEDHVALLNVEFALTHAEACMEAAKLQQALRSTMEQHLDGLASPYHTLQVLALSVDRADVACPASRRSRSGSQHQRMLLAASAPAPARFSAAVATADVAIVFAPGTQAVLNVAALARIPGVNAVTPDPDNSPQIDIAPPTGWAPVSFEQEEASESSSGVGLYAGVAGGVGGALLVAGGAVFWMRRREVPETVAVPIVSISVADIKSQLTSEIGFDEAGIGDSSRALV